MTIRKATRENMMPAKMGDCVYQGTRDANGTLIVRAVKDRHRRKLRLRLDLFNHSPSGFETGYGGSGPAQLALAILADALGEDETACRMHQKFKWDVIAKLPRDADWQIAREDVLNFVGGQDGA